MFRIAAALSFAIFFNPAGFITKGNAAHMFAFKDSLIHAFADMM
jgi:hypothetical protein